MEIVTDKELDLVLRLNPREYQLLNEMGRGMTRYELSRLPGNKVSPKTIDTYMDRLKEKLEVSDNYKVRYLATRYIIFKGLNNINRVPVETQFKHQTAVIA